MFETNETGETGETLFKVWRKKGVTSRRDAGKSIAAHRRGRATTLAPGCVNWAYNLRDQDTTEVVPRYTAKITLVYAATLAGGLDRAA
ncbi:MAG TPA: hypothetical protein VMI06_19815 [Terriglobia bacterium]|nr:hypothetical protein [Terriglobia bacterium]